MQALYLLALDPIAETLGDPNSYGFRTQRSTADAIEQCFNALARQHAPQWIWEGDIRACFDGISHDWLLAHIPMETAMLQKWLKAQRFPENLYVIENRWFINTCFRKHNSYKINGICFLRYQKR